tara:strand:+ start:15198 stop:15401 length:204 start_codon:yes stop_codon:yes gene_type:complete
MVHYLKEAIVPERGSEEWDKTVDSFNMDKFASQVNEAGAGFVMFALGQNSGIIVLLVKHLIKLWEQR